MFGVFAAAQVIFLSTALSVQQPGQATDFSIEWESERLEGSRVIQVSRPIFRAFEDDSLPILIVADANLMFGLASDTARLMAFDRSAPPMVVVGLGYTDLQAWARSRQSDLHPSEQASRGVEVFTRSVFHEVVPLVREHVPEAGGEIFVYGHSSGGLFALEAYAQGWPSGVIASSPSLNEEVDWSESLASRVDRLQARPKLFLSYGGEEAGVRASVEQFVAVVPSLQIGVNATVQSYAGRGHMHVIPLAFADGLNILSNERD